MKTLHLLIGALLTFLGAYLAADSVSPSSILQLLLGTAFMAAATVTLLLGRIGRRKPLILSDN